MTILVVLDEGLAVEPRIVTVNPQFNIYCTPLTKNVGHFTF